MSVLLALSTRMQYAALLTLCLALPASAAQAQAVVGPEAAVAPALDVRETPAYTEAVVAGVREHEYANFAEARVHFLRAHELYPNARTLRALGKVEFELRNYGESVRYLRGSLDSQDKPLDATQRSEVSTLLTRASAYVGEVHVVLEPHTATISVDGVTVATGPEADLSLVVGDHVLEFHALGRRPEKRSLRVQSGDATSLRVYLSELTRPLEDPQPNAPSVIAADPTPRIDTRENHRFLARHGRWFWPTVGAVVVGGIVTGIVIAARNHHDPAPAEPSTTPNTPPGASIEALFR